MRILEKLLLTVISLLSLTNFALAMEEEEEKFSFMSEQFEDEQMDTTCDGQSFQIAEPLEFTEFPSTSNQIQLQGIKNNWDDPFNLNLLGHEEIDVKFTPSIPSQTTLNREDEEEMQASIFELSYNATNFEQPLNTIDQLDHEGYTKLARACIRGHKRKVKKHLGNGANINIEYSNGETALMLAVKCKHKKIVKILLEFDNSILKAKNSDHNTAYALACNSNQLEIQNMLLTAGANVLDTYHTPNTNRTKHTPGRRSNRRKVRRGK